MGRHVRWRAYVSCTWDWTWFDSLHLGRFCIQVLFDESIHSAALIFSQLYTRFANLFFAGNLTSFFNFSCVSNVVFL